MRRYISSSIIVALMILGGYFSYQTSMTTLYGEYDKLWEYRRMNPETLPNVEMNRLFLAGHDTTYADSLWIGLIQYIGDNIFNGKYQYFTAPLVERITLLHPHFSKPYNLALILTPNLKDESNTYEKDKGTLEKAAIIGEKGLEKLCDSRKIEKIRSMEYSRSLWEDVSLQDPCRDDMIAYNLGYIYGALSEREKSKRAYMIASAQKESPQASRFLAVLAEAKDGDHTGAAEGFLLTALGGYDDEVGLCRTSSLSLLEGVKKDKSLKALVTDTESIVAKVKSPTDTKNPLAQSSTNCYQSLLRGAKQIYLAYITAEAAQSPTAKTSEELEKSGVLKTFPTLPEQKGWRLVKKNNVWTYSIPLTP